VIEVLSRCSARRSFAAFGFGPAISRHSRWRSRPAAKASPCGASGPASRRTGRWPTADDGAVGSADDERWSSLDQALRVGVRGLRGGTSLSRILHGARTVGDAARR
jgi:hypothetical protein